jgi:hypothetical protein
MMTAPGAPLSGFADEVRIPPRPSPSHQTPMAHGTDAASASRVVRRHRIPAPIASCTVAKHAFESTRCRPIWVAVQATGPATQPGLPGPTDAMTCVANA